MIVKAKQLRTNLTRIRKRAGVGLATFVSKVVRMTCPQCAISRGSAVVFGPRSVQRHVAAMTGALNTIQSAVVASSMPRSQPVTLQVSCAAAQRFAAQTCQRNKINRQKATLWELQINNKAIACVVFSECVW